MKLITEESMAGAKKATQRTQSEHIAAADSSFAATKAAVYSVSMKNAARVAETSAGTRAVAAEKAASKTDEFSEQALVAQVSAHGSETAAIGSEGRGTDFNNQANINAADAAGSMHLATKAFEETDTSATVAAGNAQKAAGHANDATTSASSAVAEAAEAQREGTEAAGASRNAGSAMELAQHQDTAGKKDQALGADQMNTATKLSKDAALGDFYAHLAQHKSFAGTGVCYEALTSSFASTCDYSTKMGYSCVGSGGNTGAGGYSMGRRSSLAPNWHPLTTLLQEERLPPTGACSSSSSYSSSSSSSYSSSSSSSSSSRSSSSSSSSYSSSSSSSYS